MERIEGDIEAVLAELVAQNRRFRTTGGGTPDDSPTEPPPPPPEGETYTVQPGDTLSRIALHFYGQSSLWPLIFEANRDILDDPSRIRPGMVLKIPPKPAT
ncbi:MAG: LysM peptidoglycan-binding domain-containing protein [Caldilineae bacterium]|nr:MAG: LysM peptidoglycan-binding domain-containing protein [Caldilineae bacterium]